MVLTQMREFSLVYSTVFNLDCHSDISFQSANNSPDKLMHKCEICHDSVNII